MSETLTWPKFRATHKELDKERISELWSQYKEGEYDGKSEITTGDDYDGVGGMTVEEEFHSIIKVAEIVNEENPDLLEDEPIVEIGESNEWPDGDSDEDLEVIASPEIPNIPESEEKELTIESVEPDEEPIWERVLSVTESLNIFKKVTESLTALRFKGMAEEEIEETQKRLRHIAKFSRPEDYECEKTDAWTLWLCPTNNCILVNTSKNLGFSCTRTWWKANYGNASMVERNLVDDASFLENLEYEYRRKNRFVPRSPLPGVEIKLPKTARDFALRRE